MRTLTLLLLCACTQPPAEHQVFSSHGALDAPPGTYRPLPLTWFAVGDSTTQALGGSTTGWPEQVIERWTGHYVTNIAVVGATTTDIRDAQWPQVAAQCNHGLFLAGGFNDLNCTSGCDDAPTIFARLQTVADAAYADGWTVVFVSVLPAGGNLGGPSEDRRLQLTALEQIWATEHYMPSFDLDRSPINCGIRYGGNAVALCDWAQISPSDVVHPSQAADVVIGQYIGDRLQAPQLP